MGRYGLMPGKREWSLALPFVLLAAGCGKYSTSRPSPSQSGGGTGGEVGSQTPVASPDAGSASDPRPVAAGGASVAGSSSVAGSPSGGDGGTDAGGGTGGAPGGRAVEQLLPSGSQAAPRFVDDDNFGEAIAIDGDTMVIGASGDDRNGSGTGMASVYARDADGWVEQAQLVASDGQRGDMFGDAVSVAGDTIVVGALGEENPGADAMGAAYIFSRAGAGWSEQAKIQGPGNYHGFGRSVWLSTDRLLVDGYLDAAPLLVRQQGGWLEQTVLALGDHYRIAFDGKTVVAGISYPDASLRTFVETQGEWIEQTPLLPPGPSLRFGSWLAVEGNTLVVAQSVSSLDSHQPAVYVFVRDASSWSHQATLSGWYEPDPEALHEDSLPRVALSGNRLVVSDSLAKTRDPTVTGVAYVFARSQGSWEKVAELLPPQPAQAGLSFARAAAISGDDIAIGALPSATSTSGVVYTYRVAPDE